MSTTHSDYMCGQLKGPLLVYRFGPIKPQFGYYRVQNEVKGVPEPHNEVGGQWRGTEAVTGLFTAILIGELPDKPLFLESGQSFVLMVLYS